MASEHFEIAYAAHTGSCTFLLDGEGICRRIVMRPNNHRREHARNASRCVGAQYVASLDQTATGCMVEMPRIGATMLFARVDERGRVALVRTGAVISFESKRREDPFADSVETSVPEFFSPGRAYPNETYANSNDPPTLHGRARTASQPDFPDFASYVSVDDDLETEQLRTAQYRASLRREESSQRLTQRPPARREPAVVDENDIEDVEDAEDDPYQRETIPPPRLSEPARPRRTGLARAAEPSPSWSRAAPEQQRVAPRRR